MGYLLPFDRSIQLGQQFGSNPGWGPNPAGGHNGDDWLTPVGVPVRAAGDGYVLFAGQYDSTYEDNFGWGLNYGGNQVVLNLDGKTGPYVEYGHLSVMYVKSGERVTAGQIIALTGATDGDTGVITGPHCHVGVLPWNYNLNTNTYGRVNPRLYLTDYPDSGALLAQSGTITPLEEDDMPSIEEIFDYPIARQGGSLGGETNLRSVIAYFDANVEGTRNIVKESAGAAVAAIFTTELARQGGPGGVTTLAATLAYLDANLDKLDANQIMDPEAVRAAVTAATDAALKDISITLSSKES